MKRKSYRFDELFSDETKRGKKIQAQNYLSSGKFPIIDQGKKYIAGYTNEREGLFEEVPVIIFGDHTRTVKYVDTPFFIGADGVKIIVCKRKEENIKYLYYALKNQRIPDTGYNRHFKWLKEKFFICPSRTEQDKVVQRLDAISRVVDCENRQYEKLDTLVKSRFIEMFGDPHHSTIFPYKKVKDFTEVRSGGTPSRKQDSYWRNGSIRWVKTTELQNNEIYDTEEKITQEALEHSSAKLVPKDTVLIAMYGQGKTRGMTAYLKEESTTNQACACILPSDSINQRYLWRYFMMSYEQLRELAQGAGQPNLTGEMIKNFPVLMPPKILQEQYVAFAELADKSKLAIRKLLEKQELLRAALMQEYFG